MGCGLEVCIVNGEGVGHGLPVKVTFQQIPSDGRSQLCRYLGERQRHARELVMDRPGGSGPGRWEQGKAAGPSDVAVDLRGEATSKGEMLARRDSPERQPCPGNQFNFLPSRQPVSRI